LLKKPGFTIDRDHYPRTGYWANTAIFSLVNMVVLRPLPVAEPDRVVEVTPLTKDASVGLSPTLSTKISATRMKSLTGWRHIFQRRMSLSQNGVNERVWGYLASGNYFDLLGVRAIRGRMFTQEEDRIPGANPVAVVSYGCWQRRFGGDPGLVARRSSSTATTSRSSASRRKGSMVRC